MNGPRLLLVEDDDVLGTSLVHRLELEGFSVDWATNAAQATRALKAGRYDVIVSDIRLPDGDGETVMRAQFKEMGLVPIIFMTAYGEIDQAVRLVREGARDYLSKPFDLDALIDKLKQLTADVGLGAGKGPRLATASPAMQAVSETLAKAADLILPVTLMGETGTGKEVAARFLHDFSARRDKPFVAVNAGSLQSEMADSVLFGHERGAFTGAMDAHVGFVEEADEGTLFLDEIGELNLQMQVKLLRLIEQRTFRRLGGRKDLPFKARLVCATNRDLETMVAQGRFRQDLWFRINVITATLPPLRERREDIVPLLIERTGAAARQFGRTVPQVAEGAKARALAYGWPGNVRELVNRVDRAVAMSEGEAITERDLFPDAQDAHAAPADPATATLTEAREAAERAHIVSVLQRNNGKIQSAAEQLGISRTTLWEKMNRYKIETDG